MKISYIREAIGNIEEEIEDKISNQNDKKIKTYIIHNQPLT